TIGYQLGQQAGVIDVGVGYHHRAELGGVEWKPAAVAFFVFATALAHAAFEQHLGAVAALDQIAGTSDLANGAKEIKQSHEFSSWGKVASLTAVAQARLDAC